MDKADECKVGDQDYRGWLEEVELADALSVWFYLIIGQYVGERERDQQQGQFLLSA